MASIFTSNELRVLAARASTVDERLAGGYVADDTPESSEKAARRLDAWCQAATDGDEDLFRTRLDLDGLDIDRITPLLGDVQLADDAATPAWTETFRWAIEAMMSPTEPDATVAFLDPERPLPFEDVFVPLAVAARERRDRSRPDAVGILTEIAHAALQRVLLQRACDLCAATLQEGFILFRMLQQPSALYLGLPLAGDPGSRADYDAYVAGIRRDDLRTYFVNRPVLARLMATLTELWTTATAELIERVRADLPAIGETLGSGASPGCVGAIGGGLSDPHNGGRMVFRLTFTDGLMVGYKPKDLGLDVAWRNLLGWLEAHGAPASALAPRVLERPGYGWVEWIEPAPCADAAEAARFFRRAGAMLCLFQLLQGTDFHIENIIAHGEYPVPVDLEAMMHPNPSSPRLQDGSDSASAVAAERLRASVLATAYLPEWAVVPGGRIAAIGGLNPAELREGTCWRFWDVNTDAMVFKRGAELTERPPHLPTLDGEPLSSALYRQDVMAGYKAMYRYLMAKATALRAADGPLAVFGGRTARIFLRSTQLYFSILRRSLNGRNLSDGVDWSLHFDFLSRLCKLEPETATLRASQLLERRSLQDLDIPLATARTDRRDLLFVDTTIEDYFDESSVEQLTRRLVQLSETTMERELHFIAQALQAAGVEPDRQRVEPWTPVTEREADADVLPPRTAIASAQAFATILDREAIRVGDGAAWVGAVPLPGEKHPQLQVIGHDFYAGASGVAMFLAALHRLTGDCPPRALALAALEPLRRELAGGESRGRLARGMGIGGGVGIGSVIYALVRSADLLDEPDLLDDAVSAARLITDARIAADRSLDVMLGAAGAILGLLALYEARVEPVVLERAVACGRHLLDTQRDGEAAGRAWETVGGRQLTGFSHGAAGIALALLRLHRATGDGAHLTAAQDAIAYESSVFLAAEENWPDYRDISGSRLNRPTPCQWCHGAAGIGLARLGGLDVLDDDRVRGDIDTAIETTLSVPIVAADHLCCGNFGRIEFLFTAGRHLGRYNLVSLAHDRAAQLISKAEQTGTFQWIPGADRYNPGFFSGISGVGYELLRLTHPDVLPSALLWRI